MRKSISILSENLVSLKTKVPNLRDKYEKHYILTVTDIDDKILNMLEHIKSTANGGHSFDVVVDPNTDNEAKFYIDGDGMDRIIDIRVDTYDGIKEAKDVWEKIPKDKLSDKQRKYFFAVGAARQGKEDDGYIEVNYSKIPNSKE